MKKQTVARSNFNKKNAFITVLLAIIVGLSAFTVIRNNNAIATKNEADIVSIRELILVAVRGVKKDAPVDAKTGDVYFPGSHLYLPNPSTPLTLTYTQESNSLASVPTKLSISTYPLFGTTGLYTAKNSQQLFAAVPKLQACSRGITLVYQKYPAGGNNVLAHTVVLNNGKTIYVYYESVCPELANIANLLTSLKTY